MERKSHKPQKSLQLWFSLACNLLLLLYLQHLHAIDIRQIDRDERRPKMVMSKRTAPRALLVMMATAVVILHRSLCVAAASSATQVAAPPPATKQTTRTPALFVFGDSIVDPGNNNAIITTVRCNFAPYGQDFPGHNATGRFSNGKVPGDILGTFVLFLFFLDFRLEKCRTK